MESIHLHRVAVVPERINELFLGGVLNRHFAVAILALCVGLLLPMTGYAQADPDRVSVILKLKYDAAATYRGELPDLDACSIAVTGGVLPSLS